MSTFQYLLQANLYLILFYGFYVLLLRNETFFRLNRIYLVGTGLLSFIIPVLQSDWIRSLFVSRQVQHVTETFGAVIYNSQLMRPITASPLPQETHWSFNNWISFIYLVGILVFLCRFIYRLFVLQYRSGKEMGKKQAYSFFKKIVVSADLPGRDAIYKHEHVHTVEWHTVDVLFFELISIINWINPVIYAYKKTIKHIHEFIADETTAEYLPSKADYALLLVSNAFGIQQNQLSNNFFSPSLLKRRIIMLQKTKSRKARALKYGLSAPLLIAMMIFSSATVNNNARHLADLTQKITNLKSQGPLLRTALSVVRSEIVKPFTLNRSEDKNALKVVRLNPGIDNQYPDSIKIPIKNPAAEIGPENAPLIILDGKPMENSIPNDFNFSTSDEQRYGQVLNIKPADIKNITVLKDAAAAIYGNKGKNGVLVINTKVSNSNSPQDVKQLGEAVIIGYANEISKDDLKNIDTKTIKAIHVIKGSQTGDTGDPGKNVITEISITKASQKDPAVINFASVEMKPEYPGGMAEFIRYIGKNYRYPALAKEQGVSGKVVIGFVIDKDGSVTDIKVLRDLGLGTAEEAVRVLKDSPKWRPGVQNGKAVRVSYVIPIALNL